MHLLGKTIVAVTLLGAGANALADDHNRLRSSTELSAAQEVQSPAVESDGTATGVLRFDRGFSEARLRFRWNELNGEVTRLHLHCNVAGANGPIAVGIIDLLAAGNDNSATFLQDGNRITGVLTNANFPATDACADVVGQPINNVASLAAAVDQGLIYWNLHTTAFPAGELRGQARPISDD